MYPATTERRRNTPRWVAVAVVAGFVVGAPAAARAAWSASTTVTAPLAAVGRLTTPVAACSSQPGTGILPVPFARISWAAVPGATGYAITLRNSTGTTTTSLGSTTATSIDVTPGLLGGILGGLLSALFQGGSAFVVVQATNTHGWSSLASAGTPIRYTGIILSAGLACG